MARNGRDIGSGGSNGAMERIAILGGSSVYIPEFIYAAISRNLSIKEFVLFAPPSRKLEVVARFCQRLIDKSGFPAKVIPCSELAEAVAGARIILNHIRVGGWQARMRDEMLPRSFDMLGGDAMGPGGIANALRTLPIVFDYAQQIEECNPHAIFINMTNPMGIVVEALIKYSRLKTIGVCELPTVYCKKVAALLQNVPDIHVDYLGLYHFGWIQDVRVDNRSRMSHLLEMLEARPDDDFDYDLIELFRMIPTPATSAYFRRDEMLKKQQGCLPSRSEILFEAEKQILALYENEHLNEIPELTRQRNAVWYEEIIIPLIEALEREQERELIVCLRNEQSIRDLPENCSVEIPASIHRRGIRPHKVGSLPGVLRGTFLSVKESEQLTIEAVRHKSYEYALQALVINPFVPSVDTAKRFLDKVIKEEKLELH